MAGSASSSNFPTASSSRETGASSPRRLRSSRMVSRPKARHHRHEIQITLAFKVGHETQGDPMVHVHHHSPPPLFPGPRARHLAYNARDLSRSREFYTQVLGLVASDEDRDTLYLRGVEERSHYRRVT